MVGNLGQGYNNYIQIRRSVSSQKAILDVTSKHYHLLPSIYTYSLCTFPTQILFFESDNQVMHR